MASYFTQSLFTSFQLMLCIADVSNLIHSSVQLLAVEVIFTLVTSIPKLKTLKTLIFAVFPYLYEYITCGFLQMPTFEQDFCSFLQLMLTLATLSFL